MANEPSTIDADPLPSMALVWAVTIAVLASGGLAFELSGVAISAPVAVAWGVSYLLAIIGTLPDRTRPLALSVLGVDAAIVGVVGTPQAVFVLPFVLAMRSDRPIDPVGLAALLAFPVLHLPLALAAFRTLWRTTTSVTRQAAIAGAIVVVVIGMAVGQQVEIRRRFLAEAAQREQLPEVRGPKLWSAVDRCLFGSGGITSRAWPQNVDQLGPDGLGCLTSEELLPADRSYVFDVAAPPDGARAFTVCLTYTDGGHLAARSASEVRDREARVGRGDTREAACLDSIADPLRALRFCVWQWHRTHGREYPTRTEQLVGACLRETPGSERTYVAGPTDGEAGVRSFVVDEVPTTEIPPRVTRRLDETGVVRATTERRLATPLDETDAVVMSRVYGWPGRTRQTTSRHP